MNFVRSNNLGSKYQRFTPSGYKDIGDRKFEFLAKSQFVIEVSCFLSRNYFFVFDFISFFLIYYNLNIYSFKFTAAKILD